MKFLKFLKKEIPETKIDAIKALLPGGRIIGVQCVDANHFYASKQGLALPWPHNKGDLGWFEFLTKGNILVVGDATWRSLQVVMPLKNREVWPVGKAHKLKSVEDVVKKFKTEGRGRDLFIAGGEGIWKGFSGLYDSYYLTILKQSYLDDGKSFAVSGAYHEILDKPNYRVIRFRQPMFP